MKDGRLSSASSRVGHEHQLAYQPPRSQSTERPYTLPTSPRNRFIYFCVNELYVEAKQILKHTLSSCPLTADDVEIHSVSWSSGGGSREGAHILTAKRKCTRRVIKVTPDMVSAEIRKLRAPNMTLVAGNLFDTFLICLVEYGTIQWRSHSVDSDLVVFSDYSSEDGELLPHKFCHTRHFVDNSISLYTCSCDIFRAIQSVAGGLAGGDQIETIIPEGLTCMHCQFLGKVAGIIFDDCEPAESTPLSRKIKQAVQSVHLGVTVLLMGKTHKYFCETSICAYN